MRIKGKKDKKKAAAEKNENEDYVPANLSKKIMAQARAQKEELERPNLSGFGQDSEDDAAFSDDEVEDDEEEVEELVNFDGDYVEDINISASDEAALASFMPNTMPERRNLADIIMDKIREKEEGENGMNAEEGDRPPELPPKVVEVYTQVRQLFVM